MCGKIAPVIVGGEIKPEVSYMLCVFFIICELIVRVCVCVCLIWCEAVSLVQLVVGLSLKSVWVSRRASNWVYVWGLSKNAW